MARIEIDVKKDKCLGYDVFRGCVKGKDIAPALWIDFHDEELNPYGYQRPFNSKRSQDAADYAENAEKAFWPESILAIRDNSEVDEEEDKVRWDFIPAGDTNNQYGKLTVEYNGDRTELIAGEEMKWRRAFSQVDCQHRLGHMHNSDKYVTACIIPNIKRADEALIFKTINDKQKKISTSLVDAIIRLSSTSPLVEPAIHWAYNLGIDVGSSFFKLVSSEGTNVKGRNYVVTLRTLQTSVSSLVGGIRVIRSITTTDMYDVAYLFIKNYWNVIKALWPKEFSDNKNYKLMIVPGLKGLSRYGKGIFQRALETGSVSEAFIQQYFKKGANLADWSNHGPLREASGNAGIRIVYDYLVKVYGKP